LSESTKKTPSGIPTACISYGPALTYCRRNYDPDKEFVFRDAGYAIAIYGNMPKLKVCPDCRVRYETDSKADADARRLPT
jgi:hypothetical protein